MRQRPERERERRPPPERKMRLRQSASARRTPCRLRGRIYLSIYDPISRCVQIDHKKIGKHLLGTDCVSSLSPRTSEARCSVAAMMPASIGDASAVAVRSRGRQFSADPRSSDAPPTPRRPRRRRRRRRQRTRSEPADHDLELQVGGR